MTQKSRSGPRQQAVQMAMRRAKGGTVGALTGKTGGRSDKLPVKAPKGAFVIPADTVAAIGEGNTMAGMDKLFGMFPGSKPLKGGKVPKPKAAPAGRKGYADGGDVPILVSDGEFIVSPEDVARLGSGDIDYGHEILDQFVVQTRKLNIDHLSNLPGPQK